METLQNIFSQEIVQRFGWTLIHFIWQGGLIAFLLALILRLMRKSSSNLRYATACAGLLIMVLLPAATFKVIGNKENVSKDFSTPVTVSPPLEMTKTVNVQLPAVVGENTAPVKMSLKDRIVKTTESLLPHIVCFWLAGVILLSVWYLGGWTQLQRLRRQMVKPVSGEIKTKLKQLSQVLGIGRAVDIFQSALVNVPTVIGHFKPVILLPASALTGLSGEQIEAILAHELAHIKRCDYLINILQTVVEILGFYHPAVWWVSNKIRQERENCCDDLAVNISGNNICYAEALATMEEIRFGRGELAVAAAGGNLFERIKRLLGKETHNEKASWVPSVIVILLITGLLIPMALTLSSCDKEKISKEGMNAKINRIDIDTATKDDVTKVFGEPEKYMWGDEKKNSVWDLDKNKLPIRYIMVYPDDFRVFIANDHIIEFRFEGPSDYVFGDGLTIGSSIEKAFSVLGEPKEIIDGKPNEFHENTFYKNINGKKGYGYYAVPQKNIRIWIGDDKVRAIYLTRSNYDAGPSRKLKDSELPQGSVIDANGHIVDKIDYPFIEDPQVLGNWKSVDYIREIENFKPGRQQWVWGLFLTEMVFEDNGRLISKNEKVPNGYPEKWTKGLVLYNNDQKTASKYTIKEIDGSKYMFFEWKSGDYTFRHQKPSYYVLKKVEDDDYSSVTVQEGIGFDDVIVGDAKCTREFLIAKFGEPDKESTTQWLVYKSKYGFDFWFNNDGVLSEIRFNKGFKGRLESGISMNSTMQDIFRVYGRPVKEEIVANLMRQFGNQTLYKMQSFSKIFYNQNSLLFWFEGEKISQVVVYPRSQRYGEVKKAAEKFFYDIKNADYDKYIDRWSEFPVWNNYMTEKWQDKLVIWMCQTFKENPILKIELGEVFTSNVQDMKLNNLPAVPYKLILKDGGVLDGNLPFRYVVDKNNEAGGYWQGIKGIDWHLQDEPIKKPQDNAKDFEQKLQKPVTVHIDKSPDGDRLTIQYAVIAICNAARVPYDWNKSAELANPQRTKYIEPVNIENKVASQAIADLIGLAGLSYSVDANGVYLYNPEKSAHKDSKNILDKLFKFPDQFSAIIRMVTLNEKDLIKGLKSFSEISGGKYPVSLDPNTVASELRGYLAAKEGKGELNYDQMSNTEKQELKNKVLNVFFASAYWLSIQTKEPVYHGDKITADNKDEVLVLWKWKNGQWRVVYGDLKRDLTTRISYKARQ